MGEKRLCVVGDDSGTFRTILPGRCLFIMLLLIFTVLMTDLIKNTVYSDNNVYFCRVLYENVDFMKLIADSGSTKTDWCVIDGCEVAGRLCGQGINPCQQEKSVIENIVSEEVASSLPCAGYVDEIYFYGAGCRDDKSALVRDILSRRFGGAAVVEVCSDMLAAARALFAGGEGIACILGTGSNSCLYDGRDIAANVPPLGYILGDEGSGAVLGRLFVNAMFKGALPAAIREEYFSETGMSLPAIIDNVYRRPQANRFLAGMSVFIRKHLDDACVKELVVDNFRSFFRRNVALYGRPDVEVGAVGSIAYCYKEQFLEVAEDEGYRVSRVIKSPMDGLVGYHSSQVG